ncbi:MAG: family 43 glycosylhydrolase [Suipraeoptans sp.]
MKTQAMNPFLPLAEYIPDGEPHVFGDRIYLFGSHDTEGGERYCAEQNYLGYSAPISDLSDWRCDGVIYDVKQDPYGKVMNADLYAPDVVQGNDGKYYLYYPLSGGDAKGHGLEKVDGHDLIQVAVCDTPTGKYEYYGYVKNSDGTPHRPYLDGDPAVINDDGVIRVYHGWSLSMRAAAAHSAGKPEQQREAQQTPEPGSPEMQESLKMVYKMLFHRSEEEVKDLKYPLMGANTIELADDMLTVISESKRIVPGQMDTPKDNCFYGHAFYEAASIRKINGLYYFIYSSENSHELCYATSKYPDRDFVYRGIIIALGDVGYNGRQEDDRLNMTANNHGSLECVNGQWYIFYHRQTHNGTFSRQACAEPVEILADGSIPQVECTSCGLNGGPLKPEGEYQAAYACNITNGHMPHATNTMVNADIPFYTHQGEERFITNIKDGTMIGYKYFAFDGMYRFAVQYRGEGDGVIRVSTVMWSKDETNAVITLTPGEAWSKAETVIDVSGVKGLYLTYKGSKAIDLLSITFEKI